MKNQETLRRRNIAECLKNYPKEVILKDGSGDTLRPLTPGDEEALLDMFGRLSEEELWFLNHNVSRPGLIKEWIENLNPGRVVSVIALLEGRIIANAALMMKDYGAKSHIGKTRISVDPAFRGRRLGTWMLFDLVNLAISVGVKMVVMRLVQERDARVIEAAKRLDFREESVLKNYVIDREGNPYNLVLLRKDLTAEWGNT